MPARYAPGSLVALKGRLVADMRRFMADECRHQFEPMAGGLWYCPLCDTRFATMGIEERG